MEVKKSNAATHCIIEMIGQFWEQKDFKLFDDSLEDCRKRGRFVVGADMSRVTFLSSQALGRLARAYSTLNKAGGHFVVINPVRSIRETLNISGIDQFMKIFETREEFEIFAVSLAG
jgi:anti-anti-sigma factor